MQDGSKRIVLSTLNAKYIHASFGLRYLFANLDELREQATLLEFEIKQRPLEIAERILACHPEIVGFGVYIWNVTQTRDVVAVLKRVRPDLVVVLGGPEVSYEVDDQPIVHEADYVITGEADVAFRDLCRQVISGARPVAKVIKAALPELAKLQSPYDFYTEQDLRHRMVYVEASRGCPFTCEFCLSSLDIPVRQFDVAWFLGEMQRLWERGARQYKFVDRTFNLNVRISTSILEFFAARIEPGMFVHFEMVPDRLPEALRAIIQRFPAGMLQFEVGIQSFNPEVGALISRKQDIEKIETNLRYLRHETGVHVHADLIAGLPGENLESFAAGFDRLLALGPQEIQVGILKRLRGTPIVRHDEAWGMVYSDQPPYEILQTKMLDFLTMQRLQRFSRFWDLVSNSGRFLLGRTLLWEGRGSAFFGFLRFSDWLYAQTGLRHGIALKSLAEYLYRFCCEELSLSPPRVAGVLREDLSKSGFHDLPACLQGGEKVPESSARTAAASAPARQARHLPN